MVTCSSILWKSQDREAWWAVITWGPKESDMAKQQSTCAQPLSSGEKLLEGQLKPPRSQAPCCSTAGAAWPSPSARAEAPAHVGSGETPGCPVSASCGPSPPLPHFLSHCKFTGASLPAPVISSKNWLRLHFHVGWQPPPARLQCPVPR